MQEGGQVRLVGSASIGQGYNITQSSAPDDGHMVSPKYVEQLLEEK
jgi:hypothetical protein